MLRFMKQLKVRFLPQVCLVILGKIKIIDGYSISLPVSWRFFLALNVHSGSHFRIVPSYIAIETDKVSHLIIFKKLSLY